MKRLLLSLFLFFVLVPFVNGQEITPPEVGWTINGELWIVDAEGEPLQVASGAVCCAVFSPFGTRIAYLYGVGERQASLVIMNTAPPYETMMVAAPSDFPPDSLPVYLAWQTENIFWVSTVELLENNEQPYRWRWDLWHFTLDTSQYGEVLPPGEGGRAYPSGELVAVVHPGLYGETPASVAIYDADLNELTRYEYPAVSTGTNSVDWMPSIQWVDGAVRFALPNPDLIYVTSPEDLLPSRLIELHPEGEPRELGEIEVTYPANAVWSTDGKLAAYARYFPEPGIHQVAVFEPESGEEIIIAENAPEDMPQGFFRVIDWGESGLAFYFSTDDGFRRLYFGSEAEDIQEIPGYLVDFSRTSEGNPVIARNVDSGAEILVYHDDGSRIIIKPEFETWGDFRLVRRVK